MCISVHHQTKAMTSDPPNSHNPEQTLAAMAGGGLATLQGPHTLLNHEPKRKRFQAAQVAACHQMRKECPLPSAETIVMRRECAPATPPNSACTVIHKY
jgi:hypothetical protein